MLIHHNTNRGPFKPRKNGTPIPPAQSAFIWRCGVGWSKHQKTGHRALSPKSVLCVVFFYATLILTVSCSAIWAHETTFNAQERFPGKVEGPYRAQLFSVHDGDTFRLRVLLWPSMAIESVVRLRGVDTPELQSKCQTHRRQAQLAKDFAQKHLSSGHVTLSGISKGKYYGRVIAKVTLPNGQDLTSLLIDEGLGEAYKGKQKAKKPCLAPHS